MPILQVKNLSTYFFTEDKIIKAIDGVTFDVNEAEIVAIVGESGSGKSVTVLSVVRLIDPPGEIVEGEVLWRGSVDILKLDEKDMKNLMGREIGIIFQDVSNSLNPILTVGKQVGEIFETHFGISGDEVRLKVIELFERIGINEPEKVYKMYPHQLSGGLRQRVLIAMAFTGKPKLIIADEPTSFVDALTQMQILELFKSFRDEFKTSILLVTHNFGLVSEIADKVYVMRRGKIIEGGETSKILSNPKHPYTLNLIESAKFLSL